MSARYAWLLLIPICLSSLCSPAAAQDNMALSVDGDNDFVRVIRRPSLEPPNTLTAEFWVYGLGSTSHGRILRKAGGFQDGYVLSWSFQGNRVSASFDCSGANRIFDDESNASLAREWHHFALTAASPGNVRFYIDGELVGERDLPCMRHSDNLYFGAFENSEEFRGLIDEVRFWNVERTQEQIQETMNLRINHGEGLVSVWHMDGDARDSVSQNHGTLFGDAHFVDSDSPVFSAIELSPSRGDMRGGYSIQVRSTRFPALEDPPQVFFDEVASSSVVILDAETLRVEVPPATVPGQTATVFVQGEAFLFESAPEMFEYTPRLAAPSVARTGDLYEGSVHITPPSMVLTYLGSPPAVDIPVRQYGGMLNILPFFPVFTGQYWHPESVGFSLPVPDRPELVGRTFLIQSISGPAFDGSGASFSNTVTIRIE
ncbi:MAG: LamG-like jellyroll fold domain-containing protein [Planctomycetota bacterium]